MGLTIKDVSRTYIQQWQKHNLLFFFERESSLTRNLMIRQEESMYHKGNNTRQAR